MNFFLLAFLLLFSKNVFAQADVSSDIKVTYRVGENDVTNVEYEVTLKNIFTDRYAKSYTLQLDGTSPQNIIVTEDGKPLEFTTDSYENTKRIMISFPIAVVGKDKARVFKINYQDKSFTQKSGDVWDVSIPRLGTPDAFRSYDVFLQIPASFGNPAYISPQPKEKSGSNYYFDKNIIANAGIHAAFGSFQVYDLNLAYNLENPVRSEASVKIALPPDTSYQKVYLKSIDPNPDQLHSDADGNWIATYTLNPREQKTVKLNTNIQIFNSPIQKVQISNERLDKYLEPTEYWQAEDLQIKALAQKYNTPEDIYNYIVRSFEYNHDRILPNAERLGAARAINQPENALCTEFTDAFIAIARAAGIPARELNGYAYSDNSSLQPLSLVTDVLHSWPEYWDENQQTWIAVDPTWENTTGGIDYFSTMDLKHIVFAIHGESDTLPYPAGSYKLGAYPEKNVEVKIGSLQPVADPKPELEIKNVGGLSLISQTFDVIVTNPGPTAMYNLPLKVVAGGKVENFQVEASLPFSKTTFSINAPVGFLAANLPDEIEAFSNTTVSRLKTHKSDIALYHSASILLVVLAVTGGVAITLWKRS